MSDRLVGYTDGSCKNNGQQGSRGGYGVYVEGKPDMSFSKPLTSGRQTSNEAEIRAATDFLKVAKANNFNKVEIRTDSSHLRKGATEWMGKWKANDWHKSDGKPVVNKEAFQELDRASKGMDVKYSSVKAHAGNYGNERADDLANQGAKQNRRYY